jgi:Cd2+/Zn2+-exporting ATPase
MTEYCGNITATSVPKPVSDCKSCGCACGGGDGKSGKGEGRREIAKLIIGAVLLALGLVIDNAFAQSLPPYAPLAAFAAAYALLGGGIVLRAFRNVASGRVFDENFLMSAATIGAFAIGEYSEAAGVMLFYQIGELFQGAAVKKSKKSIASLMNIRPDFANLKREGGIVKVAPDKVGVGDIIVVRPGERIPLDGKVVEGCSMIDASALTGESVPRTAAAGGDVLSGSINQSGLLTVSVTRAFGESTASKIIKLVESASGKKAKTENFITVFARYYTPAVVALALLIALLPPLLLSGAPWREWINRGLIFLVISCPCALVLSIPMSFFAGIGKAARRGILVKGGNYLEALGNLDTVVFDKTGTLTKGVFKVTSIEPAEGVDGDTLMELAASAEAFSNHPIAQSIIKEYGKEIMRGELSEYAERPGYGVSVAQNGKTVLAGNQKLMAMSGIGIRESQTAGTKVYVSANGVFAGCVVISDEVKPDSKSAIAALKSMGVRKTAMLTGDSPRIAEAVAAELGIGEAHGGLLPHEKAEKLELMSAQKRAGGKLAFVGDGINDAPVLAMADVGIAMGGLGSDAAIEAADAALMTDEPSKIAEAISIARFTKKIVWQNIVFALGVKAAFLTFGALGAATMWEAVFADVGVSLLAVLNAMRIIKS